MVRVLLSLISLVNIKTEAITCHHKQQASVTEILGNSFFVFVDQYRLRKRYICRYLIQQNQLK